MAEARPDTQRPTYTRWNFLDHGTISRDHTICRGTSGLAQVNGEAVIDSKASYATAIFQTCRSSATGHSRWVGPIGTLYVHHLGIIDMTSYVSQYRLNGDVDHHDPKEPFTTFCPSLPGQSVNVLEVPINCDPVGVYSPNSSCTSLDSIVFTLDPKDKYQSPGIKRAATTSAIQKRKALMHDESSPEPDDRPAGAGKEDDRAGTACSIYDGSPLQRQHSLHSMVSKLRRTKSSSSTEGATSLMGRTSTSWSRRLFSRASKSRKGKVEDDVPEVPRIPHDVLSIMVGSPPAMADMSRSMATDQTQDEVHAVGSATESAAAATAVQEVYLAGDSIKKAPSASPETESFKYTSRSLRRRDASLTHPVSASSISDHPDISSHLRQEQADNRASQADDLTATSGAVEGKANVEHDQKLSPGAEPVQIGVSNQSSSHELERTNYAESSFTPSEMFSPCLTYNTTEHSQRMSSIYLSQPETPRTSNFGEDEVVWRRDSDPDYEQISSAQSDLKERMGDLSLLSPILSESESVDAPNTFAGFQGYTLSAQEHSSAVTLKKPSSHYDIEHGVSRRTSTQQLVQSWDDGAEHRAGGLSGLIEDMGYLGDWIN